MPKDFFSSMGIVDPDGQEAAAQALADEIAKPEPCPEPGWHPDVPMARYLEFDAINNSALGKYLQSPRTYRNYVENGSDSSTPATVLGTAIHTALLEPENLEKAYRVVPGQWNKTKAKFPTEGNKEGKDKAIAEGFIPLKPEDWDVARRVRDNAWEHPDASNLLKTATQREVVGIWEDEKTGLRCKIRPDFLSGDIFVADLKSTASFEQFDRNLLDKGYFSACMFYLDGANEVQAASTPGGDRPFTKYLWLIVETSGACEVDVQEPPDYLEDVSRDAYRGVLDGIARCLKTGQWPLRRTGIREARLSSWQLDRINEMLGRLQ